MFAGVSYPIDLGVGKMPPPPNILDQALEASTAIAALERLGANRLGTHHTRESAIRELEASGLSALPGTVLRSLVDATYPPETIGYVVQEGRRIPVGMANEPFTVARLDEQRSALTSNLAAPRNPANPMVAPEFSRIDSTPGGRAFRHETPHHVRMTGSRRPELMDQHMAGMCMATATAQLTDTKLDEEALLQAFRAEMVRNPEPPPRKSVWDWIRKPAI